MRIPIYQVDAFTKEQFKGNPAAVCLLEKWLSDDLMQKIASEVPKQKISLAERIKNNLPETIVQTENSGYKLKDVYDKKVSMEDFIAQLDDEELATIVRAEGIRMEGGSNATLKHFACNSQEKSRFKVEAVVSERALREIYLNGAEVNSGDDNTIESLENGSLTRGKLQRSAMNICDFIMHAPVFFRKQEFGEVINKFKANQSLAPEKVQDLAENTRIDPSMSESTYIKVAEAGIYELKLNFIKLGMQIDWILLSSTLTKFLHSYCNIY